MDSFSTGFLASVAANGLTTIVSYLGRQSARRINDKRGIVESFARDATLSSMLQKATSNVAKTLTGESPEAIERLKAFAASADVDAIIRQIYATRLTTESASLDALRAEFEACFHLHVGEPASLSTNGVNALFDALVIGCDRALEVAIQKGLLSAHEAKSAARTRLILDELAAVKRMVEFLARGHQLNIAEVEDFHQRLRSQIAARHAYIVPPHFDARRRVPIDDLYVAPVFSLAIKKGGPQTDRQDVGLEHILRTLYRAVILGNPGSGKSTLATKICHDLAVDFGENRLAGRRVTPILLPLREYGRERKDKGLSVVQFIELVCTSTYQVAPPDRAVEYLMRSGRILVVFDGLDELLDTSYRQKISEDVESFCRLYPGSPVLVTSREVGYEQAPLDDRDFDTLRIAPFEDSQVQEYVTKWFSVDTELTEMQRREKAGAFLKESNSVPDLRTNPLMLALMCNIYRGENYIPRNRPDVYEKCALMLFEKWDKSRGINVPLPFEAHVRPAMMYLAYWIFSDENLQGGVTERSLIEKCSEYLCPRRYEDADDARRAATEFIDFCRGRAWVFTDTGTTKQGERLYQFTHRTFLEYFTAAHLVRTHATPALLGGTLTPRIAAREWDVVAQLAFQLQNKHVEGAGDALIGALLEAARTPRSEKQRSSMLSFASRTLEFLVPSPSLTRDIVVASLDECLAFAMNVKGRAARGSGDVPHDEDFTLELVAPLLASAEENRTPVSRQISSFLEKGIYNEDLGRAILVLQIGMNLSSFLYRPRARHYEEMDPRLHEYWDQMARGILSAHMERVRLLCEKDFLTSLNAVFLDLLTPREMVSWHGVRSLFCGGTLPVCESMGKAPILPYVTLRIVEMFGENKKRAKEMVGKWLTKLAEVAAILVEVRPPWLTLKEAEEIRRWGDYQFRHTRIKMGTKTLREMGTQIAFLAFVSGALRAEVLGDPGNDPKKDADEHSVEFLPFVTLRAVRFRKAGTDALRLQMTESGLSGAPMKLLLQWACADLSFIGKP